MNFIVEFAIFFTVIYGGYYFFVIRKSKTYDPKNGPKEAIFLIKTYKLDIKKINYYKLLKTVTLVNAFIIAFTATVVLLVKGLILEMLAALFLLIPLMLLSYNLLGRYYQKKGNKKRA